MAMFWLILACVLVGIVTFIIAAGALDIIGEADGLAFIILFIIPALSIASVIIARIIFKINFWIAVLTPVVAVLFILLIIYIFSKLDIDELPTILVSLAVFLVLVSIIPCLKIIIQNNMMNWALFVLVE